MKTSKKLLSLLLILTMVTALFGGVNAYADTDAVKLEASRSEDTLTVSMIANKEMEVAGVFGSYSYDESAFTYIKATSPIGLEVIEAPESSSEITMDKAGGIEVNSGDIIVNMTFAIGDAFEANTSYEFKFEIEEFYDHTLIDFDFVGETLTTTYKETVEPDTYTVTFDSNGGSEVDPQTVNAGEKATKPADPTKDGFTFKYWTLDGAEYDFDTAVNSNITLVAKWAQNATEPGEIDLSSVKVTKIVSAADGVEIPAEVFTFTFTATTEDPVSPDKEPLDTPDIDDVTISFAGGEGKTLEDALGVVTFPAAGTYAYTVKETKGSATGWIYDESEYTLYVTIVDNNGTLELGGIKVVDEDGNKDGGIEFTNKYETTASLTISKEVKALKTTDKFQFHITFDTSFTGTINGEDVEFAAGEAYDFELADGEDITIEGIPAGATYTLLEDATDLFTPSATVVENGVEGDEITGEYGESLTLENKLVGNKGDNKVDVVNTYSITPPTGVVIHSDMLVILALVLVALIGGFVLNRKFRSARA